MALRRRADNRASGRRDRMTRSQFLRLHVHEVVKIVNDGMPLIGYLHWSLFDNYEWGTFTPRFGLFSLDYPAKYRRRVEDHAGDRPSETYAALIAARGRKWRDRNERAGLARLPTLGRTELPESSEEAQKIHGPREVVRRADVGRPSKVRQFL